MGSLETEDLQDETIADITAEPAEIANQRAELEREIEMYEKSGEAFQQAEITLH